MIQSVFMKLPEPDGGSAFPGRGYFCGLHWEDAYDIVGKGKKRQTVGDLYKILPPWQLEPAGLSGGGAL